MPNTCAILPPISKPWRRADERSGAYHEAGPPIYLLRRLPLPWLLLKKDANKFLGLNHGDSALDKASENFYGKGEEC
jgi:hypothetical protein